MRLNSRSKRLRPRNIQIDSNGPDRSFVSAAANDGSEPFLTALNMKLFAVAA